MSTSVSSDGSGSAEAELASFGFIDDTSRTARVLIYSMVTGALLTDYTTPTNTQLQTNPTVRMDGNYVGVCLWGDNDDVPTAIVLAAGTSVPVFTYVTPGSSASPFLSFLSCGGELRRAPFLLVPPHPPPPIAVFGVDIVHDVSASTPTSDRLYFAVGGKHVPANAMGNGGDSCACARTCAPCAREPAAAHSAHATPFLTPSRSQMPGPSTSPSRPAELARRGVRTPRRYLKPPAACRDPRDGHSRGKGGDGSSVSSSGTRC